MTRSWKRNVIPILLTGTMTFSFGAVVHADNGNNENGNKNEQGQEKKEKAKAQSKFKDINDHWAQDIIEKMAENNIINGYTDSTFRPNKPVTQLEAVAMVMNLLTQTSDDLRTDGVSYTNDIPSWAKDRVELALSNDIVSWEDMKNFNKPATRMFIVNLLVNSLDADLDEIDEDNLFFGDIDELSSKEKAYLTFALGEALVQGYQDKTFQPNKPVTRAEMAVFASRLFDKVVEDDDDYESVVNGTISSIDKDDEELTIGSKTYQVSDDVTVKIDDKTEDFEDLEKGMEVRIYLEDGEIKTIYANTTDEQDNVEFTIEKDSDGNDDDFEEAVLKGDTINDTTPDLSDGELSIILNDSSEKEINLEEIDGNQDDGFEVADELEKAIEDALGDDNRVNVKFEDDRDRFIFETNDSPTDEVPSIQFDGDEDVLNDLGLSDSVVEGSLGGGESWKIIVDSDATEDQTYEIELQIESDDEDIEETVEFSVVEDDTAEEIANKIANALDDNSEIQSAFEITVDDEEVTLDPDQASYLDVEIEIFEK